MSANKYANLPDIDTAPDVYETEEVFPSSQPNKADSSDDDTAAPPRSAATRTSRHGAENGAPGKEELDSSNLIGADEASRRFRKAERRRRGGGGSNRVIYTYPSSPTDGSDNDDNNDNDNEGKAGTSSLLTHRALPLSHRLRVLQAELTSLERELADPSNPQLHKERVESDVDPGELIRGLVDVRGRIEKIRKGKEGRARLVNAVLAEDGETEERENVEKVEEKEKTATSTTTTISEKPDVRSVVEMDRRVGELEKLVGSSSASLDETSPLPPPLLPLIGRLNTQLTLLTQPRHIDSISRRLKLLLSDLERASAAQHREHSHKRNGSNGTNALPPASNSHLQEQLLPLLTRLGPSLPHIPHILTRLRTLSALHTSAGEFQDTLKGLEEEQVKTREALKELGEAVTGVEGSLEENKGLVKGNVDGLERRVDALLSRLEDLGRDAT